MRPIYKLFTLILFTLMTAFMCSWPHDPHLFSTVILGVYPLHQIAHVGVSQRISPKLFSCEIILEKFQPM